MLFNNILFEVSEMPNTLKVIVVVLRDASVEDVKQFIKVIKDNPKVSEVKVLEYPTS